MSSFRKTFKPTKDEKLKDYLFIYHILLNSIENQNCSTCKNRIEENFEINGIVDFSLECKFNKSKENCNSYEYDATVLDYVFNLIKDLLKD